MVIAIFQGGSLKDHGVEVHSILEEKDCIRVQFGPMSWQTAFSHKPKFDSQSFAFIVLPKSGKAIVFEEDVRGQIHAPPIWKERARLPAMDKK